MNIPDFVRDTFHCDHNEVLSKNVNDVWNLCSKYYNNDDNNIKDELADTDPVKVLNNICQKDSNRLAIAQFNNDSL